MRKVVIELLCTSRDENVCKMLRHKPCSYQWIFYKGSSRGVVCFLPWDDCGVTGWLMETEATWVDDRMCKGWLLWHAVTIITEKKRMTQLEMRLQWESRNHPSWVSTDFQTICLYYMNIQYIAELNKPSAEELEYCRDGRSLLWSMALGSNG